MVEPRLIDLFVSQNSRKICVPHFSVPILVCADTTCSDGHFSISCLINRDNLPYPVVFSLKLFLRYFAALVCFMINCFVDITT